MSRQGNLLRLVDDLDLDDEVLGNFGDQPGRTKLRTISDRIGGGTAPGTADAVTVSPAILGEDDVQAALTAVVTQLALKFLKSDVDTDNTLAANSDLKVASQKAVKAYVLNALSGISSGLDPKGNFDCAANPNYPAASKGDMYTVTLSTGDTGKIGGGSGDEVAQGDFFYATADNAGGTKVAVGASWAIVPLATALLAGIDAAIAIASFTVYAGGPARTTVDRFADGVKLKDTSIYAHLNDADFDNAAAWDALVEDVAFNGLPLIHEGDDAKVMYVTESAPVVEGDVIWKFHPSFQIRGIGDPDYGVVVNLQVAEANWWGVNFYGEHVRIDNSLRTFAAGDQSGMALRTYRFNHVYDRHFRAYGGERFDIGDGGIGGDSGMGVNDCNSSRHDDFRAVGQADLGLYITGANPDSDPNSPFRGGHDVFGLRVENCGAALNAKRLTRRLRVIGGHAISCAQGIQLQGAADGLLNVQEVKIIGFDGKKLISRLVSIGIGIDATVVACHLEDWGHSPYDAEDYLGSIPYAFASQGGTDVRWIACSGKFNEWAGAGNGSIIPGGFILTDATHPDTGLQVPSTGHMFSKCYVRGAAVGVREENGATNNRGDISMPGVTTKIRYAPGSVSILLNNLKGGEVIHADNADISISPANEADVHVFTGALTGNRTVTLGTSGKQVDKEETFVTKHTGAFTWTINGKAMPPGQFMRTRWNGTIHRILEYGSGV